MGLWTWILYHAGGYDFLVTFYGFNQLGRFLNAGMYTGGHVRPFYYYLTDFWVQGAPWSLLMIPVFITVRPFDTNKRFFCAWLLGGIVLLSMASTKRGLYLLPLMPAMAVMVAAWMSETENRVPEKWELAVLKLMAGFFALCYVALPFGYVYFLGGEWTIALAVFGVALLVGCFIQSRWRLRLPWLLAVSWCLAILIWSPAVFPQLDQQKGYKDLFIRMGRIVAGQGVVGYQLNETVEALAPFYGGFFVENIEEKRTFIKILKRNDKAYVIVLPSRLRTSIKSILAARGVRLIKDEAGLRKDIELWKLAPSGHK
jgi:4-amino-4-deoxy-L-arabinose transferase-like glycosyltransferase